MADLNISRNTIMKRNQQLRNLGYELPRRKPLINFIDIIDTITSKKVRIERKQLALYFNITEQNAMSIIKRGKYKNYRIEKVYV